MARVIWLKVLAIVDRTTKLRVQNSFLHPIQQRLIVIQKLKFRQRRNHFMSIFAFPNGIVSSSIAGWGHQ